MSKLLMPIVVASTLPLAAPAILAQTTANERNCPSSHQQAEAIPPYVGTGSAPFSPNQSLCLPRLAPGGGDADIAVNEPDPITHIPNLPLTSLLLAPGVTGTHSTDRGDTFSPPNLLAALIGGDDRQWNDAIDAKTGYLVYHDIGTF